MLLLIAYPFVDSLFVDDTLYDNLLFDDVLIDSYIFMDTLLKKIQNLNKINLPHRNNQSSSKGRSQISRKNKIGEGIFNEKSLPSHLKKALLHQE
jgi:hypothetical protein